MALGYTDDLEGRLRTRAARSDKDEVLKLWQATITERDMGFTNGPFSRAYLDTMFGVDLWWH